MSEPPDWLKDYVQVCVCALGLQESDLYLRNVENLEIEGERCLGFCDPDPRYLRGSIKFDDSIEPNKHGYRVVTHEMMHVVFGPLGVAVDRILDLVPSHLRDHALEIWKDAVEPTAERTARGLTPILRPAPKERKRRAKHGEAQA